MLFDFWKYLRRTVLLATSFVAVISSGSRLGRPPEEPTLNNFLLYPSINETHFYIGSLFPIHSANLDGTKLCGELQSEDGILPLETFLFAIDEINKDKTLLPNITIGGLALDSCNSPEVALQQSLRYMKGFIATESLHSDFGFTCKDGEKPVYENGMYENVVGVIGDQRSSVSVQIANVLRLFKVPQISYRSTSASLSDRKKFPYFLRTVPSDNNQAEVIINIMEYLNISYASLIYSNNEYGLGGYKELMDKARGSSVCFASSPHVVQAEDPKQVFQDIAENVKNRTQTRVIVLFADLETAKKVLAAFQNDSNSYLWIGSDAWTSQSKPLDEFSDSLNGSISLQPLALNLPRFKKYFTSLNPGNNIRNPWFREYWEQTFNCSLDADKSCSENALKVGRHFDEGKWLHFVRDSVYAFAHALHAMWQTHCNGQPGICPKMTNDGHIHGEDLFTFLKDVSFQDVSGKDFHFQKTSGSGIPRYTAYLYRKSRNKKSRWIPLTNFTYESDSPSFSVDPDVAFPFVAESVCGKPCGLNEEKIMQGENQCCWSCKPCSFYQFLNSSTNSCDSCDKCHKPINNSGCFEKENRYLKYTNQWAVTSMAFASLGIFSTIFVGIIFWIHLDTPVIKAASRELSYILLTGIFISFGMTFAILAPPSIFSCGFTRFFLGFSYTICYSAILTKTSRIYRIFNKNPAKPQKAKFTSPTSQMVIVTFLVSVEAVINISWLMYYAPDIKIICEREAEYNVRICKGIDDYSYIVGFIYPLSLVCFCTMFAIKTRKCPDGFNEARYIAFTNYTTCLLWLIFVPLYLNTPAEGVRLVSLSMSLSLGAFVQLGCLFIPKVHTVLFKPEKNTRDSVMSPPKTSSVGNQNSITNHPRSAPAVIYVNDQNSSMHPEAPANRGSSELFKEISGAQPNPSPSPSLRPVRTKGSKGSTHLNENSGNINPIYLETSKLNINNIK